MMRQTSLDAYAVLQVSKKLSLNQILIIDLFKKLNGHPLSNMDVATMLGWSINRVTPRVNELVKSGVLMHCGYKVQLETGKRVMLWCRPNDFVQFLDISYEVN